MSLSDINDRQFVLSAVEEFDRMGRDAFLAKYAFGASRAYWLFYKGKHYDSKAILGAAHAYARPDLGPLGAHDFVGGDHTVRRKLNELGFDVDVAADQSKPAVRTSERLQLSVIYTRDDLKELFNIEDATINTGVFQPKAASSVWLFVTEEKTADRTQYKDRLEGDTLYWQGQTAGRKDALIIDHKARGLSCWSSFGKANTSTKGLGSAISGFSTISSIPGLRPQILHCAKNRRAG